MSTHNDSGHRGDSCPIDIRDMSESIHLHMKAISGNLMKSERKDHTLNATALVNQAVLKLMSSEKSGPFANRSHLLAAAAKAMQRILVDHARGRNALKRSAGGRRITWEDVGEAVSSFQQSDLLLQLSDLLQELANDGQLGERRAEVLRFRLFGGMEIAEIGLVMEQEVATVDNDWRYAKRFISERLEISGSRKA